MPMLISKVNMANNFFLNNDPLLYHQGNSDDSDLKKLNEMMANYKMMQQNQQNQYQKDYVGELDKVTKGMDSSVENILNDNKEYCRLNQELRDIIQNELMSNIRWKVNLNPIAIKNIERQMELITDANNIVEKERKESLNQLNDYVKNYSNITFDEYKKIKENLNTKE